MWPVLMSSHPPWHLAVSNVIEGQVGENLQPDVSMHTNVSAKKWSAGVSGQCVESVFTCCACWYIWSFHAFGNTYDMFDNKKSPCFFLVRCRFGLMMSKCEARWREVFTATVWSGTFSDWFMDQTLVFKFTCAFWNVVQKHFFGELHSFISSLVCLLITALRWATSRSRRASWRRSLRRHPESSPQWKWSHTSRL